MIEQVVVIDQNYRHELAFSGLLDVLDITPDQIVEQIDYELLVFKLGYRRWRRGQFLPREVSVHRVIGERVEYNDFLSPLAQMALIRWNARASS